MQESHNGSGAGNGRGTTGGGEEVPVGDYQFTFEQPSEVAKAYAGANAGRKIAAVGEGWRQRAALVRQEGKGHEAAPMTAGEDKDERTVLMEEFVGKEIRKGRELASRETQLVEKLERLGQTLTVELSLSKKECLRKEEEVKEAKEYISLLRDSIEEYMAALMDASKETEELEEALRAQKSEVTKTKESVREKEKQIKALEEQAGEDSKSLEDEKAALRRTQDLLEKAREATTKANDRADSFEKERHNAVRDASGLSAKIDHLRQSEIKAQGELTKLRLDAKIYEDAAVDIKFERDRNKALNKEIRKLQDDINALSFKPGAGEYRKKSNASRPKTLEDELAEAGQGSVGEVESDGEIQAPLPVMPKVIERVVTKIVNKEVFIDRKVDVFVDREVIIDRPFQTSSHHPIKCWFQVELNFLILFYAFVANFVSIFTRFVPARFVRPAIEDSADLTPSNPTSGDETPTNNDQHPPATASVNQQPSDSPSNSSTELAGDEQSASESQSPSTESSTIDLEPLRPKLWAWSTITNPETMPPARSTIIGLGCHLIVYAALLLIYAAHAERGLWLAANDSTRVFVHQLRNNPDSFRSGVSKILFMLPEEWKHSIDRMLFRTVVLGLNMQISTILPG